MTAIEHSPGLLMVGHGTRDPRGVGELITLVERIAERLPSVAVRPAFLELAEPTISASLADLLSHGVRSLVVSPVLLFAAGHAKEDIPRAIDAAMREDAKIPFVQTAHLGLHEQLVLLSSERFREATAELAVIPADETLLLLVGRGSRDSGATSEMIEFSRCRQRYDGLSHVTTSFFAMAEPRLESAIKALQNRPFRRIVVQPHLLFHGQILDRIAAAVHDANRQSVRQEWILCEHLGPSARLAQVFVERYRKTGREQGN